MMRVLNLVMAVGLMAASPAVSLAASPPAAHSRIPYKAVTEGACTAALAPDHATGGSCASKIGRRPAAALAKYCMYFAPTRHAPCNSDNSCQELTGSIYGYCRDMATDADPQVKAGGQPDPNHLPCGDWQKNAADWEQVRRVPAR